MTSLVLAIPHSWPAARARWSSSTSISTNSDQSSRARRACLRPSRHGQWSLTGSQDFSLMAGVTDSMTGRAAATGRAPRTIAAGVSALSVEELLEQLPA